MRPIITEKGLAAATQAATLGVPAKITHIGLTETGGAGAETDESLPNALILPVADGKVISSWQVNVSALLPDTFPTMEIKGIAFYLEDGTMFATYRKTETIISHTGGTTLLIGMDFVMSNIPPESVTVESTEANLVLGDWVPVQRRVNGKGLNADIILNATDVNAAPSGFGLGTAAPTLGNGSCNDAVMTGWYGINGGTTDTPKGPGPSGSALHVIRWSSSVIHQTFYDYTADRTHTRRCVGGVWQPWVMMYNTENPPPAADLSAYVPKTRKVNNKALDADVTLSASDVGAAPSSHSHSNYVPTTRKVNGNPLSSDVTLSAGDVGAYTKVESNALFYGNTIGYSASLGVVNLDDYTTAGVWYQSSNANATSGQNYPVDQAGSLVVYQAAGVVQEYRAYNSTRCFRRAFYSTAGGWTPWAEDYNTRNIPSATAVGALSLSGGGTVAGDTFHTGLTAFVNARARFSAGSGTHHSIQAVGNDLYFSTGPNGETLRMAIRASGVTEFTGRVNSGYTFSRTWAQAGMAAFHNTTIAMGVGMLAGLVSGLVNITGQSIYEHGYGFLSSSSISASAHAFFCTNGGAYNRYWLLKNDGELASPNGTLIDDTGNLFGSTWGGNLKAWVTNNFAPKITNVNQIQSFAFACLPVGQGDASWGSTISGSLLRPAAAAGNMQSVALTGTWMCCGSLSGANTDGVQDDRTTLWMRVS